jgi:hypothetical protein
VKVLSLTTERTDANAVATALHPSFPAVKVTWAARFEDAARWIGDNRDVDVLVLDAPGHRGVWILRRTPASP